MLLIVLFEGSSSFFAGAIKSFKNVLPVSTFMSEFKILVLEVISIPVFPTLALFAVVGGSISSVVHDMSRTAIPSSSDALLSFPTLLFEVQFTAKKTVKVFASDTSLAIEVSFLIGSDVRSTSITSSLISAG